MNTVYINPEEFNSGSFNNKNSDIPVEKKDKSSEKISDKILPEIDIFKSINSIKNTSSFKKSKKIAETFKKNVSLINNDSGEIDIKTTPPLFKIDLNENGDIEINKINTPIEIKNGNTVLKLNKETLKNRVNKYPDIECDNKQTNTIQPATKNAYEIRSDVLNKAVEIVKSDGAIASMRVDIITDKVLEVAKRLYQFVENKHK